jgi:hypothetical protein
MTMFSTGNSKYAFYELLRQVGLACEAPEAWEARLADKILVVLVVSSATDTPTTGTVYLWRSDVLKVYVFFRAQTVSVQSRSSRVVLELPMIGSTLQEL